MGPQPCRIIGNVRIDFAPLSDGIMNSQRPARRFAIWLALAGPVLGCRAPAAPEEKVPPAPVKWEAARQLVLEEWTELVGTTQPLPDHAARVTAPVEGRVLSVLGA